MDECSEMNNEENYEASEANKRNATGGNCSWTECRVQLQNFPPYIGHQRIKSFILKCLIVLFFF